MTHTNMLYTVEIEGEESDVLAVFADNANSAIREFTSTLGYRLCGEPDVDWDSDIGFYRWADEADDNTVYLVTLIGDTSIGLY